MLTLPIGLRIYLANARVDGKKCIDGLGNMVRIHFGRDPLQGDLFALFSIQATQPPYHLLRPRPLRFDHEEIGERNLPPSSGATGSHVVIEAAELLLILEGIGLRDTRRRSRWVPQTRTLKSISC